MCHTRSSFRKTPRADILCRSTRIEFKAAGPLPRPLPLSKTALGALCGNYGTLPRFALDRNGAAHVVYVCNTDVVYATNKTGSWTYSTVASGTRPDIAVSEAGVPAATYFAAGNIYLRTYDGSAWSSPTNITGGAASSIAHVAYDANGKLHVVCLKLSDYLAHYSNVSGTWELNRTFQTASAATLGGDLVITGVRGRGNFTKYAPEMTVALVESSMKVYTRGASSWSQSISTSSSSAAEGNVVYGADHWARVGFREVTSLKYRWVHNSGGSWSGPHDIQGVTLISSLGLSVDSTNKIHAAFSDAEDVFYSKETSPNVFSAPLKIRDSSQGISAGFVDLAIDGADKAHLVYTSADSMSISPIYYSEKTSGSFQTTASDVLNKAAGGMSNCGTQSTSPRIVVTRAGKAWITYNCTMGTVVATNVSGSWVYLGLGSLGVTNRASIALDATETPYVVIRDAGGNVAVKWGTNFMQSWAVAAGTATSVDPAVAVDDTGVIHVLWQDSAYVVKHSWRYPNGEVGIETVYSASNSVPLSRSIGIDGVYGSANH